MQYSWLNKKNNKTLLIFFAGWSFDTNPFGFLKVEDLDVLVIYDYCEISPKIFDNLQVEFDIYDKINLVCWSMGVFVAQIMKDYLPQKICKKVAINGTMLPVHNEFGIPQKTFDLTLKFVESGLKGKFYQNIFHKPEEFDRYLQTPVQRTLENRAKELKKLNEYVSNSKMETFLPDKFYDFAIVSKFDKIIPTKNQLNFWEKIGCDIIELEAGHFPFYNFETWNEIIDANKSPNC